MTISTIAVANDIAGATVAATVPVGGVPAGAVICVVVCDRSISSPAGSVTDTAGNTYAAVDGQTLDTDTSKGFLRIFYAFNVSALVSGNTITYTKAVSGSAASISCLQITGVDTVAPLDTGATAKARGNSATPSVTSGTPHGEADAIIGAIGIQGSSGTFTQDATNGAYATPPDASVTGTTNSDARVNGGSLVHTAATAKIYAPTYSVAKNWAAMIVAFKRPRAPGAPAHYYSQHDGTP